MTAQARPTTLMETPGTERRGDGARSAGRASPLLASWNE